MPRFWNPIHIYYTGSGDSMETIHEKPRVVLVGPLPPHRGGICEYNRLLSLALMRHCQLTTVSFHKLYPRWLYPGKETFLCQNSILDPLRRSSWYRAMDQIAKISPNRVVFHWWTGLMGPMIRFFLRNLEKSGVSSDVIIHNAVPREIPYLGGAVTRWSLNQCTRTWVHNSLQQKQMHRILPDTITASHFHPTYFPVRCDLQTGPDSRPIQILFFGFIRRYKGVNLLLEIMQRLPTDRFHLTVAGEWWGCRGLLKRYNAQPNITVRDWYHKPTEVAEQFEKSHLLILPYSSGTSSGVGTMAGGYGVPMIGTDLPCFEGLSMWRKVQKGDTNGFVKALKEFSEHPFRLTPQTNDLSWDHLASQILSTHHVTPIGQSISSALR